MGFFDKAKRYGKEYAGWVFNPGGKAYDLISKPYDSAKDASRQAGAGAQQSGYKAADTSGKGMWAGLNEYGGAKSAYESLYGSPGSGPMSPGGPTGGTTPVESPNAWGPTKGLGTALNKINPSPTSVVGFTTPGTPPTKGSMSDPGYLEKMYEDYWSKAAPAKERMLGQGFDRINQQMLARGGYNSGAALAGLGNYQAEVDSQFLQQEGDLAARAQAAREGRLTGAFDRSMDLGGARSGLYERGYGKQADYQFQGDMAKLEAQLMAAGYDAAKIKDILGLLGGLGGAAVGAGMK